MRNRHQRFGDNSEAVAARHLQRNGYRIIARNYHGRRGEVDIIARDGDTLVFVEVKARRSDRYGSPKGAVTPQKQKQVSMAALEYLKFNGLSDVRARFDVVAICADAKGNRIEIVKNAFELAFG
jgi:putative endonuclease